MMSEAGIELVDAFAAASLDAAAWSRALRLLADATSSARGELIGVSPTGKPLFQHITTPTRTTLDELNAIDGYSPAVSFRVAAGRVAGTMQVAHEVHYRAAMPGLRSDDYLDFCRDEEIPLGCQAALFDDARGLVGLTLLRSERDGPTTPAQRGTFAMAMQHARSAVHIQRQLGADGDALLMGALEAMRAAVFLYDSGGAVRHRTPAADALLAEGRLRLRGGTLASAYPDDTRALAMTIRDAATFAGRPLTTLVLRTAAAAAPLIVDVASVPRDRCSLAADPRVMVVVRAHQNDPAIAARLLQRSYGLTPAEADVATALAQGARRDEIASRRNVGIPTVQSQIKSLFDKLHLNREAELAAMVRRFL